MHIYIINNVVYNIIIFDVFLNDDKNLIDIIIDIIILNNIALIKLY